jgi:hypothetical protein
MMRERRLEKFFSQVKEGGERCVPSRVERCVADEMALKLLLVEGKQLLEVADPVFCQVS